MVLPGAAQPVQERRVTSGLKAESIGAGAQRFLRAQLRVKIGMFGNGSRATQEVPPR